MTRADDLRALLVEVEELRDRVRSNHAASKALWTNARRAKHGETDAWRLLTTASEMLNEINALAIDLTVKLNEALR